jgi:hypothetical protein
MRAPSVRFEWISEGARRRHEKNPPDSELLSHSCPIRSRLIWLQLLAATPGCNSWLQLLAATPANARLGIVSSTSRHSRQTVDIHHRCGVIEVHSLLGIVFGRFVMRPWEPASSAFSPRLPRVMR